MSWRRKYGDKTISAEQAAKLVKSCVLVRLQVGKAPILSFIFQAIHLSGD